MVATCTVGAVRPKEPSSRLRGKSRTQLVPHKAWEVLGTYRKRPQSHRSEVLKAQKH